MAALTACDQASPTGFLSGPLQPGHHHHRAAVWLTGPRAPALSLTENTWGPHLHHTHPRTFAPPERWHLPGLLQWEAPAAPGLCFPGPLAPPEAVGWEGLLPWRHQSGWGRGEGK